MALCVEAGKSIKVAACPHPMELWAYSIINPMPCPNDALRRGVHGCARTSRPCVSMQRALHRQGCTGSVMKRGSEARFGTARTPTARSCG